MRRITLLAACLALKLASADTATETTPPAADTPPPPAAAPAEAPAETTPAPAAETPAPATAPAEVPAAAATGLVVKPVSVLVNDTLSADAPAAVAPDEPRNAGLVVDFLITGERITGFKESSLSVHRCTAESEGKAADLAKSVQLPVEVSQTSEDGTFSRFSLTIPHGKGFEAARTLKLKGSVVAYGHAETETSAVIDLPPAGSPGVMLGRHRISCAKSLSKTAPGLEVTVDGGMSRFCRLILLVNDVEVKDTQRLRTPGATLLIYPIPVTTAAKIKVVTWKPRPEITVPFSYGE